MHTWAQSPRALLLGHRGCRGAEVENSFAAFDRALADGCDGFEFDVRISADGKCVVCHDDKFRGLTIAHNTFEELTSASPRKSLLSSVKRLDPKTLELPCLADVLQRYGARAFLDIELKVAGVEAQTLAAIREAGELRGYVVSSFLPDVLRRVCELEPATPVGYIFDTERAMKRWSTLPGSYVMPHYKLLSPELMREFREARKTVITWTVNRPPDMTRVVELGVAGVIADDTRLLRDTLNARGSDLHSNR